MTDTIALLADKVCYRYHLAKRDHLGKNADLFKKICEDVYKEEKLEKIFESVSVFKGVVSRFLSSRRPKKTIQKKQCRMITDSNTSVHAKDTVRDVPYVPEFSGNENDGASFVAGQIAWHGLNPDSY